MVPGTNRRQSVETGGGLTIDGLQSKEFHLIYLQLGGLNMGWINEEMKGVIEEQRLSYVATASKNGRPNVSPKGSIVYVDENTLAFAAVRSEKTLANIQENPWAAVAVLDVPNRKGFQFKGKTEKVNEGDIYNRVVEPLKKRLPKLPSPQYVVVVRIDEVHTF